MPAGADISRAFERPRDPFRDAVGAGAAEVQRGYQLFTRTAALLPEEVRSSLSCSNCHLNAGQHQGGLPLAGVAHAFPRYNTRLGRVISLEDRITGCLIRSLAAVEPPGAIAHENAGAVAFPSPRSPEIGALAAYLRWLSQDADPPSHAPLAAGDRLPLGALDPARGERLYAARCAVCHGDDGQGVHLGMLHPGPLWGPRSWSDGAGLSRTWTLAAFILRAMPYSSPGTLRADEAQHLAAFINAKPRPRFPHKDLDYPGSSPPEDAIHYR